MKDLKKGIQSSIFLVKLLMAYVVTFCLLPIIAFIADLGDLESEEECWNSDLELSLILCLPLFCVIIAAFCHFRRMPILAVITVLIALFHIFDTLGWYFSDAGFLKNFPPGFEVDLSFLNISILALTWAVPFVVIYLVWRFWLHKGQSKSVTSAA